MRFAAFLSMAALSLVACDEPAAVEPTSPGSGGDPHAHLRLDTFDCPLPLGVTTTGTGPRIPGLGHVYQRLSPDGRKLAFIIERRGELAILDIASGVVQPVDVQSLLPADIDLMMVGAAHWCPYDNSRLLVHAVTWTDTTGDGRGEIYGHNAYIINLATNECVRVTPMAYGRFGAHSGFFIQQWLPGSRAGNDSLLGEFSRITPAEQQAVYVPQSDEMIVRSGRYVHSVSPDGERWLTTEWDFDAETRRYWVNGVPLRFQIPMFGAAWYSWSPDGRWLALSVMPKKPNDSTYAFEQIWIVDIDALLSRSPEFAPVSIINAQERFCTYAMRGHWPTFITNSTLAVSMHRDGDRIQPLWEITTDGRRVRQLTR